MEGSEESLVGAKSTSSLETRLELDDHSVERMNTSSAVASTRRIGPPAPSASTAAKGAMLFLVVVQSAVSSMTFRNFVVENRDNIVPSLTSFFITTKGMEILFGILVCILFGLVDSSPRRGTILYELGSIVKDEPTSLLIPAILMVVSERLVMMSLANASIGLSQLVNQFTLFATAVWSVLLLGSRFLLKEMVGIVLLTSGVALLEVANESVFQRLGGAMGVGLVAMVGSVALYSFALVYLERVLKSPSMVGSVRARVVQLAVLSLCVEVLFALLIDGFRSFEGVVSMLPKSLMACFSSSLGKFFMALVIKYTSSVHFGFSVALAATFAVGLTVMFFRAKVSFLFDLGVFLVFGGVFLFGTAAGRGAGEGYSRIIDDVPDVEEIEDDTSSSFVDDRKIKVYSMSLLGLVLFSVFFAMSRMA